MTDFKEQAWASSTFCILPFTHIATKTNGEFKLCCRSLPLYNIKEKGFLDVWNSEKYRRIRKQLLTGERPPECRECWKYESIDVRSMRQREIVSKCINSDYIEALTNLESDYTLEPKLKSIELKLNNLCNLKCRMCHPVDSVQWAKDWHLIEHLQKENEWTYNNVRYHNLVESPYLCEWENHPEFFDDIEKIVPTLRVAWFSGGEPLIDPMHYVILDKLKSHGKNITLQYATNLTRLGQGDKNIIDYWKYFMNVRISISIDGTYDLYEYVRTNGKFSDLTENLYTVRNAHDKGIIDAIITSNVAFQAYNIFDLPKIFDFLYYNNITVMTNRVCYPKFLSSQVLPKELKELVSAKIRDYIADVEKRSWEPESKKNLITNVYDNLNFMNGKDLSSLWPQFLEYSRILDSALGCKPLEVIRPEIKRYLDGK